MYEHERENELRGLAKEGLTTPTKNNEFSFGSRPATAQTNDYNEADNSMVNMGQLTVDRKNNLLGNKFQSPDKNQHYGASATKQQLKFDQSSDSQLQAQLEALKVENERILAQIAQQKQENSQNMANMAKDEGVDLGNSDDEEDYEEDHFDDNSNSAEEEKSPRVEAKQNYYE